MELDRTTQYKEASENAEAARKIVLAYLNGSARVTKKAFREAALNLEFWGSKAAMLQVETGWAS